MMWISRALRDSRSIRNFMVRDHGWFVGTVMYLMDLPLILICHRDIDQRDRRK